MDVGVDEPGEHDEISSVERGRPLGNGLPWKNLPNFSSGNADRARTDAPVAYDSSASDKKIAHHTLVSTRSHKRVKVCVTCALSAAPGPRASRSRAAAPRLPDPVPGVFPCEAALTVTL